MLKPEMIKEKLLDYKAPRWEEFPSIELYIDQMIELLSAWLQPLYFDQNRPSITSSMINNYVKNSIVEPPHKKKIYRLPSGVSVCCDGLETVLYPAGNFHTDYDLFQYSLQPADR